MEEKPFFCESCQIEFGMGQQVRLEDEKLLPICDLCWEQMAVVDRLKFAAEIRRQETVNEGIEAIIAWLAEQKNDFDPFGLN